MTATIIPAHELTRRRAERDQRRQQRAAFIGSILSLPEEEDQTRAPASPVPNKEIRP